MCPGLGEWWLHNGILNLPNLISMFKLCLGFYVDTIFCVKWLAKLSIFIHADILVLVSEFVVVVILSEWWLFYLSGGRCRPLPTTVGTSLMKKFNAKR